jgi:hypothetical protein
MNLLRTIIERLNQRIEVANIFDKQFNLCELNANGNDKAWVHYIGNGQAEVVTNFDAKNGTLFWAKRSKVTVNKTDAYKVSGCKQLYITSFPLTAYAIVKKSHLPCDSEDAQDWLASRIYKLSSGTDPLFKQSIGVINYEVVPTGYINEIKTLTANYEWACVSVDMDVQVITSSEDGCYDTCATGDIPLPDLQPCTPCLTEVAVDGLTIIGNGTPADPLIAVGGGGGGGVMTAIAFSTDHLASTGNQYVIGNVVWYIGNIYRCIANNDSLLPTNTTYWTNIGAGFQTIERPIDWNATSGNNQILNKPTIPPTIVELVSGTAPIASSGGATPAISISQASTSTDGYLSQTDWDTFNNKFDVPTGTNTDYLDGTGTPTAFPTIPSGTVTSVDLSMPAAFSVTGNPVTTSGTLAVAAAGVATQYIRGDGQLANFPTSSGGGASVSYYLNGSVNQGTLGGVAFKQISGIPVIGAGTDFTINADGYIQSFITDATVPNQLAIPAGNWNFEMYFSASSAGGSPRFYIELYKLSAGTLTLLASSSANPEFINNGTAIDLYTTAVAVPSTVLLAADRLAIRVYVIHSSKTITLHTEDNHLCQVITTFSTGLTALNGLTEQVQLLAVGNSGTDFAINSTSSTHTFNLPTASASNRGALSSADWTAFNSKVASVSGTAPIASSGGATPAISIADAAADGATKGAAAFTAADFNAASGVISIDYTNGQAASSVNKGFLTAADWNTFNNKGGSTYKSTTDTAAVTGTTANTKVFGQLVPANTFATGDIIQIRARISKVGTAGLTTLRVYINTADSLTVPAATLISTSTSASNAQINFGIEKNSVIKSATVTQNNSATTSGLFQEPQTSTAALTNSNIDWTVNQYIIFAIQNGAAGDSTVMSYFQITKQ